MLSLAISKWGTAQQKEYWLPQLVRGEKLGAFGLTEPEVGSNARGIRTMARAEEDGYVLNGKKKWITMGQIADVFVIFANLNDKPTAFLVEKNNPGLEIKPITGLLGVRASMLAELTLDNCHIPSQNLLGREGSRLTLVALSSLDYGRFTIALGCVGLAQACLEACVEYVKKRRQFGQKLIKNQLIQKMITEMIVEIRAARLLCYKAAYLKDIGEPDSIMETWIAKYHASKMVNKVAADAVQILGANGCQHDYPVERYFRDAKINEIIEGTSQTHELMIAANASRLA